MQIVPTGTNKNHQQIPNKISTLNKLFWNFVTSFNLSSINQSK